MERVFIAALAAALLVSTGSRARAETRTLTLDAALALARQRAPELAAARARIAEAEGRLRGASVPLRDNPRLEGLAGSGLGEGASPLVEVTLWQPFELGERRSARMRAARAGIAREAATAEVVRQRVLRDVAVAFVQALHARERAELEARAETLAQRSLAIAERRQKAGESGALEVNVLASALSRVRAERHRAAGDVARALLRLRLALGFAPRERLVLQGRLEDPLRFDASPGSRERAELRAARAELAEADAEVELGRGSRWPDLALGVRYVHADGESGVLGGLALSLPIFERAQGPTAEASARRDRAALELGAARRALELESAAADDVSRSLEAAAHELEREALPKAEENARLAERAFAAGEFGLSELLTIQRESLLTGRARADALLEARVATIERRAARGELR